jgi:hypothetical protein
MTRPVPPEELTAPGFKLEPSLELAAWAYQAFINEDAPLCNEDHAHLRLADIAFLWTNVEYVQDLMPVAGMAEIVKLNGKPWPKAERTDHLCMLHGNIPQARVWLYAPFAAECSDEMFCALVEHELYHLAQKHDKEGEPKFDDEDRPELTARAHDVSEFLGVVRRYGVAAVHPNVKLLVELAQQPAQITAQEIAALCGSCRA